MTPEQYARATAVIKSEQSALAEARLRTLRRAVELAQAPENVEARAAAIAAELLASGASDFMLEAGLVAERLLAEPGAREAGDARRAVLKAELQAQRIAVIGNNARKDPAPLEHGKERTYIAGCRCVDCIAAAASARRVRRANAERARREGGQRLDYALAI